MAVHPSAETDAPIYGLSLCSGVLGLELSLRLALGERYRCLAYVEREANVASQLVALMEAELVDAAVVWDDIATFPGKRFAGLVSVLTCGFPCTPSSAAGKRKGTKDKRWIWPAIAQVISEVGPTFIFLENVRPILSVDDGRGMGQVLGTLASLGYAAEWDCFTASEMGAPHKRERLFLLAYHPQRWDGRPLADPRRWSKDGGEYGTERDGWSAAVASNGRGALAYSQSGNGRLPARSQNGTEVAEPLWGSSVVADAAGTGLPNGRSVRDASPWGTEQPERRRSSMASTAVDDSEVPRLSPRGFPGGDSETHARLELAGEFKSNGIPLFPPGPTEHERWRAILAERPDLAPAITQVAPWPPEPTLRFVADGTPDWLGRVRTNRPAQLRALGNAVIPVVAAASFIVLAKRLGVWD